jgi:hypothetical protein
MEALRREIGTITEQPINVLFLSHLDSDHVSGVDTLVAHRTVGEVVLPYLNDDEWALHLAAAVSSGTLSVALTDLVTDPIDWFASRGFSRVTFIQTSGDDDEVDGPGPDLIEPTRGELEERSPDSTVELGWTRSTGLAGVPAGPSVAIQTVIVGRGGVGRLSMSGYTLNWVLAPYAFRPSPWRFAKFSNGLIHEFGASLTAAEYAAAARTVAGRQALRRCYDSAFKDHNLHSLVLYSGPLQSIVSPLHHTAGQGHFVRRVVHPGWLSNGDYGGAVKRRRVKLLNYYSRYVTSVGHITLPHHGSDLNFHSEMLTAFPNLAAAVVAYGQNSYGHPGPGVQRAVGTVPQLALVRVQDSELDRYWVIGRIGA